MANIPIYRQDYRDAEQIANSAPSQYAGFAPNTFTPALSAVALTSGSANLNVVGKNATYGDSTNADFKDHKTMFVFKNTSGASQVVTFLAGDTYAAQKMDVTLPSGECAIWLDSSKFANKVTGEIKVQTSVASIAAYAVEMR